MSLLWLATPMPPRTEGVGTGASGAFVPCSCCRHCCRRWRLHATPLATTKPTSGAKPDSRPDACTHLSVRSRRRLHTPQLTWYSSRYRSARGAVPIDRCTTRNSTNPQLPAQIRNCRRCNSGMLSCQRTRALVGGCDWLLPRSRRGAPPCQAKEWEAYTWRCNAPGPRADCNLNMRHTAASHLTH